MPVRRMNCGFTFLELLFVLAVVAVMACLVLAALTKKRTGFWRSSCMSNHSQLGKACVMYANVNANLGLFPDDGVSALKSLNLLYDGYVRDARVFRCPNVKTNDSTTVQAASTGPPNLDRLMTSYGYDRGHGQDNGAAGITSDLAGSPRTGAMDATDNSSNHGRANRRGAGQNVLAAAGSVEWFDQPFQEINGQLDQFFVPGPATQGDDDTLLEDD
ncbi:MAG: prepilin-type N-terminal cleavage/methylation domain-containing protein [Planctomycetes bacterium]|nr:prepilin-type N-terminal cleavage/methylation domain-containing protein [Planctomycetota bacterium]